MRTTTRGKNAYICEACSRERGLMFVGAFDNASGRNACYFCGKDRGGLDLTRQPPSIPPPKLKRGYPVNVMVCAHFLMEEGPHALLMLV